MSILIDTSIFYALFDPSDRFHRDSTAIVYHILKGKYGRPYTIDYVLVETTLLMNSRGLMHKIPLFIEFLYKEGIKIININSRILNKALKIFLADPKISLTDSAEVVVAEKMGIRYIASFDKFFSKFGLIVLGKHYINTLSEAELLELKTMLS